LSQSGSRCPYASKWLPSFRHEPFDRCGEILDAALKDYPVSDDLWHEEMLAEKGLEAPAERPGPLEFDVVLDLRDGTALAQLIGQMGHRYQTISLLR
jgi:hypothetical protein